MWRCNWHDKMISLSLVAIELKNLILSILFFLQSSFTSVSPSSLDYLLQQQQQQQEELINHQQQSLQHLESSFTDILFSQNQQERAFIEQQAQHSNSSSDTLVGIEEETSQDLLTPTITHFKEEPPFLHTNPHTPTNPQSVGEQESDLIFETSSTEELGLLSLRSSSDPTLANTSQRPSASEIRSAAELQLDANSLLPSFSDTYSIKYNLSDFGLKMDEDCCFNVASAGHSQQQQQQLSQQQIQQQTYQQGHHHGGAPYGGHHHTFNNPAHSESHYLQNVGSFYQQQQQIHQQQAQQQLHHNHHHHYDSHSLVSF